MIKKFPGTIKSPKENLSNQRECNCINIGWGKLSLRLCDYDFVRFSRFLSIYRPRFLQYNYMYDYRLNYYDDVIDYLDKKDRGIKAETPRPQIWAERVLRNLKE